MDDQEYYRKMREQYSHTKNVTTNRNFDFTKWTSRQGREDAQMLQEKKNKDEKED